MERKINIAELLKDCPKGMELDCPMYDKITLEAVYDGNAYPIKINTPDGICSLSQFGCFSLNKEAKCIIFPKGKTTWEGFVLPFKDGDVVATTVGDFIAITRGGERSSFIPTYCVLRKGKFEAYIEEFDNWAFDRLATEAEKQKLFQAIKDNGYKWNAEKKCLEKLNELKFKVGDIVEHITDSTDRRKIEEIDTLRDMHRTDSYSIRFEDEDDWNLVPDNVEPKFKVGDKITEIGGSRKGEIFYIDVDKYHVAVSNSIGIDVFFEDQDNWGLVSNKFDITTLKPFDRVLGRDTNNEDWKCDFFSHYTEGDSLCRFTCAGMSYVYCVPFAGNEHLLGTTNDCDEYYKIWE